MKTIKILFVEDEKLLRTLFEDTVTGFGEEYKDYNFEMETAIDLKSSFEYLEEKPAPNIVILDLRLPTGETGKNKEIPEEENGFAILRLIKTDKKFLNTPVIVFTNLDDRETEYICNKIGADGFMIKSKVLPSELLDTIVKLAERKHSFS